MKKTTEIAKPIKPRTVTFNLTALDGIIAEGDKFLFDPKAETFLSNWIEFKRIVEETEEAIKKRLKEAMEKTKTLKVTGTGVTVTRQYFGARYEITDPAIAVDLGFATEEKKYTIDADSVSKYVKETESLPEGIKLRNRTESIVIKEK